MSKTTDPALSAALAKAASTSTAEALVECIRSVSALLATRQVRWLSASDQQGLVDHLVSLPAPTDMDQIKAVAESLASVLRPNISPLHQLCCFAVERRSTPWAMAVVNTFPATAANALVAKVPLLAGWMCDRKEPSSDRRQLARFLVDCAIQGDPDYVAGPPLRQLRLLVALYAVDPSLALDVYDPRADRILMAASEHELGAKHQPGYLAWRRHWLAQQAQPAPSDPAPPSSPRI
jgi:hypothetical protein